MEGVTVDLLQSRVVGVLPINSLVGVPFQERVYSGFLLKVHKIANFFDSDFGICVISLLVMHK
jgi:hypothetical protein